MIDWAAVTIIVIVYAALIFEGEVHGLKKHNSALEARVAALERYIVERW